MQLSYRVSHEACIESVSLTFYVNSTACKYIHTALVIRVSLADTGATAQVLSPGDVIFHLLRIFLHYHDVIMGAIAYQITSLTIVYSTVYLGADKKKHQRSASLAFVRGIHRGPVNSPHKWPVTRKMSPFDDIIMDSNFSCLLLTVPLRLAAGTEWYFTILGKFVVWMAFCWYSRGWRQLFPPNDISCGKKIVDESTSLKNII